MRSIIAKNGIVLGLLLVLVVGNSFASEGSKDILGTWNCKAPQAPYEYTTGKLIFTEEGEAIDGKVKIGNYEIDMRSLKIEDNKASFGIYVDGEYVSLNLTLKNNTFSGTASYSEGSLDITGAKE